MKRTIVFSLALAALPLLAQEKENKWDISKVDVSKLPPAATEQGVTYDKDIQPLFQASCIGCHGEQKPHGGFRLDSRDAVLKGGRNGKMVVAGDSAGSLLVAAAAQIDDKIAMPPKRRGGGPGGPGGPGAPPGAPPDGAPPSANSGGPDSAPPPGGPGPGPGGPGGPGGPHRPAKPFTAEQVGLLRAWIDQGAN